MAHLGSEGTKRDLRDERDLRMAGADLAEILNQLLDGGELDPCDLFGHVVLGCED
jgi:hypothetical protein